MGALRPSSPLLKARHHLSKGAASTSYKYTPKEGPDRKTRKIISYHYTICLLLYVYTVCTVELSTFLVCFYILMVLESPCMTASSPLNLSNSHDTLVRPDQKHTLTLLVLPNDVLIEMAMHLDFTDLLSMRMVRDFTC
jgi:hypothetical protein